MLYQRGQVGVYKDLLAQRNSKFETYKMADMWARENSVELVFSRIYYVTDVVNVIIIKINYISKLIVL